MKDKILMVSLKRKKRGALDKAIKIYTGYVTSIAYSIIGKSMPLEDVEEVVSDTFILLWRNASKLDEDREDLKPYLSTIARNASINKLRNINQCVNIDEYQHVLFDDSFENELEFKEKSEILKSAVEELNEPERSIFYRYYYCGYKIRVIAKDMDLNISTVKTKMHRGKKELKAKLIEKGYCYGKQI